MKKAIFICVILLIPAVAMAQKNKLVVTSDTVKVENGVTCIKTVESEYSLIAKDKVWYVRLGGGIQSYLGENDWKVNSICEAIVPEVELGFGRWLTNCLAIDFGCSYGKFKGLVSMDHDQNIRYKTGEPFSTVMYQYWSKEEPYVSNRRPEDNRLYKQYGGHYFNIYGSVMVDMITTFAGYKEDRIYTILPYLGFGYIHGWGEGVNTNSPSINVGLVNQFKLGEHLSLNVNLRGMAIHDSFDNEKTPQMSADAIFGLTGGLVYNFGKARGSRLIHETYKTSYK